MWFLKSVITSFRSWAVPPALKEVTFGMRLNNEQEPNLGRAEGETLQEEQITNAKPLNWE